ncbi:MAG: GNAT family N-acetyltransferase [Chloroflexota bacterium]
MADEAEGALAIRAMAASDYDAVVALWRVTDGIGLSAADERGPIETYLARNPGMSRVAFRGEALVGAVLCGHDGRRGYVHHLAVVPAERGRGLGRELMAQVLGELARAGIGKANIVVYGANAHGQAFWRATGWAPATTSS